MSKWEEVTGKWGVKKEVQEDVILQNITVHVSLGYGGDAERLHDYHHITSLVNALKHSGVASLCVVTCNHTPPFSNYSLTTRTNSRVQDSRRWCLTYYALNRLISCQVIYGN